jgi:hypothetical protein
MQLQFRRDELTIVLQNGNKNERIVVGPPCAHTLTPPSEDQAPSCRLRNFGQVFKVQNIEKRKF